MSLIGELGETHYVDGHEIEVSTFDCNGRTDPAPLKCTICEGFFVLFGQ